MIFMRLKRKTLDYQKYNQLLKEENESLTRKIAQLEKQQERTTAEKEKALEMLNRYKGEYESLIQDAKHLIEKQKESDKIMNDLVEELRGELTDLLEDTQHHN